MSKARFMKGKQKIASANRQEEKTVFERVAARRRPAKSKMMKRKSKLRWKLPQEPSSVLNEQIASSSASLSLKNDRTSSSSRSPSINQTISPSQPQSPAQYWNAKDNESTRVNHHSTRTLKGGKAHKGPDGVAKQTGGESHFGLSTPKHRGRARESGAERRDSECSRRPADLSASSITSQEGTTTDREDESDSSSDSQRWNALSQALKTPTSSTSNTSVNKDRSVYFDADLLKMAVKDGNMIKTHHRKHPCKNGDKHIKETAKRTKTSALKGGNVSSTSRRSTMASKTSSRSSLEEAQRSTKARSSTGSSSRSYKTKNKSKAAGGLRWSKQPSKPLVSSTDTKEQPNEKTYFAMTRSSRSNTRVPQSVGKTQSRFDDKSVKARPRKATPAAIRSISATAPSTAKVGQPSSTSMVKQAVPAGNVVPASQDATNDKCAVSRQASTATASNESVEDKTDQHPSKETSREVSEGSGQSISQADEHPYGIKGEESAGGRVAPHVVRQDEKPSQGTSEPVVNEKPTEQPASNKDERSLEATQSASASEIANASGCTSPATASDGLQHGSSSHKEAEASHSATSNLLNNASDTSASSVIACRALELIQKNDLFRDASTDQETVLLRSFFTGKTPLNDDIEEAIFNSMDKAMSHLEEMEPGEDILEFFNDRKKAAMSMFDAMKSRTDFVPSYWTLEESRVPQETREADQQEKKDGIQENPGQEPVMSQVQNTETGNEPSGQRAEGTSNLKSPSAQGEQRVTVDNSASFVDEVSLLPPNF